MLSQISKHTQQSGLREGKFDVSFFFPASLYPAPYHLVAPDVTNGNVKPCSLSKSAQSHIAPLHMQRTSVAANPSSSSPHPWVQSSSHQQANASSPMMWCFLFCLSSGFPSHCSYCVWLDDCFFSSLFKSALPFLILLSLTV